MDGTVARFYLPGFETPTKICRIASGMPQCFLVEVTAVEDDRQVIWVKILSADRQVELARMTFDFCYFEPCAPDKSLPLTGEAVCEVLVSPLGRDWRAEVLVLNLIVNGGEQRLERPVLLGTVVGEAV